MGSTSKKLTTLAMVLSVGLSACKDSTGPGETFDPVQSNQEVQAVQGAFTTDVYQSLEALGDDFSIPGANLSIGAATLARLATGERLEPGDLADAARRITVSSSAAMVVLIPEQYRGLTLAYDPTTGEYVVDDQLTGAPTNGIRFLLYAVNPVTGEIAVPLNEIGFVDMLDESTDQAGIVRLVVNSSGTEYMNYTVSLSGTALTPSVKIEGFVTDGSTRVDIELTNTLAVNIGGVTITLKYALEVPSEGFEILATLVIEADAQGQEGTFDVDVSFTGGDGSVRIAGVLTDGVGTLDVTFNDELFATIDITATTITATGADGTALTVAELRALEDIVDSFEDVFDSFDTFFDPVAFLFDFEIEA